MQIRMLGPLEVRSDAGEALEVGGARLRTLLIVLALEPGRVVSTARLVDGIWGEEPPAGAVNAVQALVSRLRRALPEARIESHPAGYRLAIEPDAVDVSRFERLVAAGDAGVLREALELWRGPALLDVAGADFAQAPITRLDEQRLQALENRVEADLKLGRGAELTTELAALVTDHPMRERLVGQLMRAFVAAGRTADALAAYERARAALAEELGADPSSELSALHTAVLRGEAKVGPAPAPADGVAKTNLRSGLTSFVGRDEDIARVGKLVGEYRLTTLIGPGGFGKTRLAVEVGRTLVDEISDGVWLVELAPVGTGADLPQAVLAAVGLREQTLAERMPASDPVDRIAVALRTRSMLLLLDNCEHLIGEVAALADRLLGECPRLRILATSREPLGLTGEALWPVEPLALPPADAGLAEALSYAAVRLLSDRAVAARPEFAVTADTVGAVVRICRALDGMPLAIELAAARLRTLSPQQLAARLDDRFRLLTGGARTALPRHQTLRAVVDWSWEPLSEPERVLLRRLAVFSGGATADAAEQVCGVGPDVLDQLTDKSLLVTGGNGRYRMLETIKAYALERLDEAGERDELRRAHAVYFAELAEAADPHLRRAEQLIWLARLRADHDNIIAALRGAIAAGDKATAVRLVAAAGWYWWLAGHKAEGSELTAAVLALPGESDPGSLALAYGVAVLFATAGLGDEREAAGMLTKARELAEQSDYPHPLLRFLEPLEQLIRGDGGVPPWGAMDKLLEDEDPWIRAQARINRSRALVFDGNRHAEAQADAEAAVAEFRAVGERWGLSFALWVLSDLVAEGGDLVSAQEYLEEAVVAVSEVGTLEDVLFMRARLAQVLWLRGDTTGSAAVMAEADRVAARVAWPDALAGLAGSKAELARWMGDLPTARRELTLAEELVRHIVVHPVFHAMRLDGLGYVDALEGDLDAARAHRTTALEIAVASRYAPIIAKVLVGIADHALRVGRPAEAAALLTASDAVRGTPDRCSPDTARIDKAARAALGDLAFTEATRAGQGASIESASELASITLAG